MTRPVCFFFSPFISDFLTSQNALKVLYPYSWSSVALLWCISDLIILIIPDFIFLICRNNILIKSKLSWVTYFNIWYACTFYSLTTFYIGWISIFWAFSLVNPFFISVSFCIFFYFMFYEHYYIFSVFLFHLHFCDYFFKFFILFIVF